MVPFQDFHFSFWHWGHTHTLTYRDRNSIGEQFKLYIDVKLDFVNGSSQMCTPHRFKMFCSVLFLFLLAQRFIPYFFSWSRRCGHPSIAKPFTVRCIKMEMKIIVMDGNAWNVFWFFSHYVAYACWYSCKTWEFTLRLSVFFQPSGPKHSLNYT